MLTADQALVLTTTATKPRTLSLLRQCESSPFTIMAGLSDVVELVADQSSFAARTSLGEIYRWGRFVIRQER